MSPRLTPYALTAAIALLLGVGSTGAQPGSDMKLGWNWRLDVAPVYQGKADLEGGGDYAANSLLLRFRGAKPLSLRMVIGFSVDYDYTEHDFSSPDALDSVAPWGDTERVSFGAPLFYRLDGGWGIFATPSISYAKERDASVSNSWVVGGIIGGAKRINPRLSLGIGAGIFSGLEELRFFIFPSVNWQVNDSLTVTNPFRAGPTGPAGLEARWAFKPQWEFAGGAARRSFRFRLDDQGLAPDGVGQDSLLLTYVRVSRDLGRTVSLDLYAGAGVGGELQLENDEGKAIAREDYDTAPLFALGLRSRF